MRGWFAAVAAAALVGGCSQSPGGDGAPEGGTVDAAEETPAGARPNATIAVSIPQIAYIYRYAFDVPGDSIAAVQDRHIALCDRLGPNGCRVIEMQRASGDAADASGSLKLTVRADLARAFGRALAEAAARAGGTQAESSIAAEDLSRQIVDTEARLRSRQALADRLMDLLRTRNGPVADLVAAERAVAEVQEEIDAARSWLAEARGRVATSTFELRYAGGGSAGGFVAPLRGSIATMAGFLGQSMALLMQLAAVLLPWLLVGGAIGYAARRWRGRRAVAAATSSPTEG
ncbi:MAG: DUF4349 domain-containing protein [Sphingomonas sp.]